MWVEFVVDSRPCSERFYSGCSGFPLSSKTNISTFHFDLVCQSKQTIKSYKIDLFILLIHCNVFKIVEILLDRSYLAFMEEEKQSDYNTKMEDKKSLSIKSKFAESLQ